jgi:uncharacterized lipoprotein YddW (UPF0748 family)
MRWHWTAVAALAASLLLADVSDAGEVRGLWVVRTGLVSPEEIDRVVERAEEAGLNALFLQVRGRGDAFYASKLQPRSTLLAGQPSSWDPLEYAIGRARARGLAVHAWVNVLLTGDFGLALPSGHELTRHPEWVMVPRAGAARALGAMPDALRPIVRKAARGGDAEGYYLSPSVPEVVGHLESVVRELVGGYALDGLHLDFIRYPGPEYDYSRAALLAFRPKLAGRELLSAPDGNSEAWDQRRRDSVTSLVGRLASAAREARPGIFVSAAVVPARATAVSQKFQDWPTWLANGLLNAVCPMVYTTDDRLFRRQVQDAREVAGRGPAVWAGIGAYRMDLDGILGKLALARAAKADGVILFSHESLGRSRLRRLREAFLTEEPPPATEAGSTSTSSAP